jgi:hypothetical protein
LSASAPTLALDLHESSRLRAGVRTLHALALVSVLALRRRSQVRALLGATLLLVFLWSRRRQLPPVRRLELAGDGQCVIVDARGATADGRVGAGSLALPGLVVLEFERRGRRRALWLASDAFPGGGAAAAAGALRVAA